MIILNLQYNINTVSATVSANELKALISFLLFKNKVVTQKTYFKSN